MFNSIENFSSLAEQFKHVMSTAALSAADVLHAWSSPPTSQISTLIQQPVLIDDPVLLTSKLSMVPENCFKEAMM